MAQELQLISTTSGAHMLYFGVDEDELCSFAIQIYLEKFGARIVEWFETLGIGFVSFMGADIWVHNSEEVPRNNFYGEQKYSEIGIIINEEPHVVKVLDSLFINTSGNASLGEWEITQLIIPESINYPDGMYSRLPKERFEKREGVLYAEFLRNMRTTSSSISQIEALTGEPLRGEVAYMIMRNTDTEQVKLFKLSINMTESKV